MLNDLLANILSKLGHYEKSGKKKCQIHPVSKVALKVLEILQNERYIGSTEKDSTEKGGVYTVNLIGQINKCGVIKPRFSVTMNDYEKYEKRYLPAKGMGVIIVSTAQGIMTHEEAKNKNTGGRLIAYCY